MRSFVWPLLLASWAASFCASEAPTPWTTRASCPERGTIHVGASVGERVVPYGLAPSVAPAQEPTAQTPDPGRNPGSASPVSLARAVVPRAQRSCVEPFRRTDARSATLGAALRSFLSHPSTAPPGAA